jgi:hypothetical protein
MVKIIMPTAMLLAAFSAYSGAAPAKAKPPASLCRAPEPVLFTCRLGTKTVSICGREEGGAC